LETSTNPQVKATEPLETIVESGPLHETEVEHEYDDDQPTHDNDGIVSASSLFAKEIDCKLKVENKTFRVV